mmetsp:Transcript_27146/g.66012  ORF Transcript_27146/g.66012 Transcript_27146/m.66012 type:complete len:112 (+) Transcript_27146:2237-2572(+)
MVLERLADFSFVVSALLGKRNRTFLRTDSEGNIETTGSLCDFGGAVAAWMLLLRRFARFLKDKDRPKVFTDSMHAWQERSGPKASVRAVGAGTWALSELHVSQRSLPHTRQ